MMRVLYMLATVLIIEALQSVSVSRRRHRLCLGSSGNHSPVQLIYLSDRHTTDSACVRCQFSSARSSWEQQQWCTCCVPRDSRNSNNSARQQAQQTTDRQTALVAVVLCANQSATQSDQNAGAKPAGQYFCCCSNESRLTGASNIILDQIHLRCMMQYKHSLCLCRRCREAAAAICHLRVRSSRPPVRCAFSLKIAIKQALSESHSVRPSNSVVQSGERLADVFKTVCSVTPKKQLVLDAAQPSSTMDQYVEVVKSRRVRRSESESESAGDGEWVTGSEAVDGSGDTGWIYGYSDDEESDEAWQGSGSGSGQPPSHFSPDEERDRSDEINKNNLEDADRQHEVKKSVLTDTQNHSRKSASANVSRAFIADPPPVITLLICSLLLYIQYY